MKHMHDLRTTGVNSNNFAKILKKSRTKLSNMSSVLNRRRLPTAKLIQQAGRVGEKLQKKCLEPVKHCLSGCWNS
jgi:hypothetical protein